MDAVPADCVTLPEAVAARAKITTDYELQRAFGDFASLGEPWTGPDGRSYLCREFAVRDIHRQLIEGSIAAYIRDPRSGERFRLLRETWEGLAFYRETLTGGVIHAAACELMEEFDGQTAFVPRAAVEHYLHHAKRRKPATLKQACQTWLENLLRTSPHRRSKPKAELRREAMAKFRVTWREFGAIWNAANRAVPEATWRHPGAPKQS